MTRPQIPGYIPIEIAIGVALVQAAGSGVITYLALKKQESLTAELIHDMDQTIHILQETSNFLLDRADDATAVELNKHLDYWRVVRGLPTET